MSHRERLESDGHTLLEAERTLSAQLRAIEPTDELPESAYQDVFRRVAALILNGVTWHIGGRPYRFTEIEIYYNGAQHRDTFTHGDAMQRELGRWYFHRSGEEYRGGTYKGLDIAFGREDVFAGILVRGAESLADGALIDGPCMCADRILAVTGRRSIRELLDSFDRSGDAGEGSPLYVTVDEVPRAATICESPRVGLTLKRGVLAERARFLARPYRFLSEPARIKKGRLHTALGLHREGHAVAQIAAITGMTAAQVEKYVRSYEAGQRRAPADFNDKDLSADEVCQLFGACDAFAASTW